METQAVWVSGPDAWKQFLDKHPELGYRPGRMNFHNFLRYHRKRLVEADAIRLAKNKFWIAHLSRFCQAAFDCATGHFAAIETHATGAMQDPSAGQTEGGS